MAGDRIALALVIFGMIAGIVVATAGQTHAQTDDAVQTSEQVTLSKNLEEDPLAQDILAKIEKTRKQIANIEHMEKQRDELEEKRAEALAILQRDLKAWESLWEKFTFDYAFERKTGIFWDQYNFTYSKILAGRAALQEVLSDGGDAEEARSAYVDAAKMKRSEIIEANSLFNVKHGFAYYDQQILFESDGQFHDIVSGDQIRKYYQDFRTSPAYLNSNPNDETSWTDLAVSIQAECKEGHVLIHRFSADDYVCVTEQTSEMWSQNSMGKPMTEYVISDADDQLTAEKFREDTIREKVKNINSKINAAYSHYGEKVDDLKKKYSFKSVDLRKLERENEKAIIDEYNSTDMLGKEFMERIEEVRERYDSLEEIMLEERDQVLKIMESNHEQYVRELVRNYESISDVEIVWSESETRYEATRA